MAYEPTDEQVALIGHDVTVHARVLAGPGTGKSATMVSLIDRLGGEQGSLKIRLLTFTRAATAELADKVSENQSLAVERPSTIHSFAISILMRNGAPDLPRPLRMADDWERRHVVDSKLSEMTGIRKDRIEHFMQEMASGWERLEDVPNPDHTPEERARFLAAWREHREVMGYTMLGELPFALMRLLEAHPDLEGVDYDVLVVDEYQDLNACDLEVLKLMAERGTTVIGAGDDDQSIYSFRRAHPIGIRQFLDDYEGAVSYPLSISHRCGQPIIDWANEIITGDLERPEGREVLVAADGSPEGEVASLRFDNETSEARGAASIAKHLIEDEGLEPSDILILMRGDYNGQFSAPVKEALDNLDIPYSDPDRPKHVLEHPDNRQVFEASRLLNQSRDSLAWASLFELTPNIGPTLRDYVYERAKEQNVQFGAAVLSAHDEGFPDSPQGSGSRAAAVVSRVLDWTDSVAVPETTPDEGWGAWIGTTATESDLLSPREDLIELLVDLDEVMERDLTLGQFLGQALPLAKDRAANLGDGVRIMTMATSKGLTVGATVAVGLEETVIPSSRADRSEEVRLLYVAMTRARKYLYLTWARRRRGAGARAGGGTAQALRVRTSLLDPGSVGDQAGNQFIAGRWG